MDQFEMAEVYIFNNERRDRLLQAANEQPTPFLKLKFVVDYFINNLSLEQIAKIDTVPIESVKLFEYDYSFLEDYNSSFSRIQKVYEYKPGVFAYTLTQADTDLRDRTTRIYPTIFALKMATCQMFASEIQRFAMDFGIDSKIQDAISYCYDNFSGSLTNLEHINYDRIVKMHHYYNILNIDGEELKVDIAGFLTALDYNENHPQVQIDTSNFYFSPQTKTSPFNDPTRSSVSVSTNSMI